MTHRINKVFLGITVVGLLMLGASGARAQNLNTPSVDRALTAPDQPMIDISDQKNRQLPQTAPSDVRDDAYTPEASNTYKVDGGVNEAAPLNDNNPYSGPGSVKVNNDAEAMQVPPGIVAVEPPIGASRQGDNGNNQASPRIVH